MTNAGTPVMSGFLYGLWNGVTAWPLLVAHGLGVWHRYPIYSMAHDGGWYQLGFLIGAGSPFMGFLRRRSRRDPP
jgi:hypothetical protein